MSPLTTLTAIQALRIAATQLETANLDASYIWGVRENLIATLNSPTLDAATKSVTECKKNYDNNKHAFDLALLRNAHQRRDAMIDAITEIVNTL